MDLVPAKSARFRRFQFSLRTLLIAIALAALPCIYLRWLSGIVRERDGLLAEPSRAPPPEGDRMVLGTELGEPSKIPWPRRLLGDVPYRCVWLDSSATGEDLQRYRVAFPEAEVRGVLRERGTLLEERQPAPAKGPMIVFAEPEKPYTMPSPPRLRGDVLYRGLQLYMAATEDDIKRYRRAFPEATVYIWPTEPQRIDPSRF